MGLSTEQQQRWAQRIARHLVAATRTLTRLFLVHSLPESLKVTRGSLGGIGVMGDMGMLGGVGGHEGTLGSWEELGSWGEFGTWGHWGALGS